MPGRPQISERTLTSPPFPTFSHEARLYGSARGRVKGKKPGFFNLFNDLATPVEANFCVKKPFKNKKIATALKVKCQESRTAAKDSLRRALIFLIVSARPIEGINGTVEERGKVRL